MRTQIALDDEQHARVKQKAHEMGVTMAHYIRMLIDRDLGDQGTSADIADIFGIGRSGGSDIANEPNAIGDAIASYRSTTNDKAW